MTYSREFDTIDELDRFVEFQKSENGLEFHWDRVARRAWIECLAAETYRELKDAETYGS